MRKAMRSSSRKADSPARLTTLGPDSVACSPVSAYAASSMSAESAYNARSLRLPSFSSTTSIASSSTHSTVAPLSKMFSLPSRPSMRRLVPSPSMPSLRIDLRRERSRTDLRTNDERHLSSSPPEQDCSLSTVAPTAEASTSTQTSSARNKLHGARQMLFSSTRRRSERSSTSTRKSGESVLNEGFWQPPSVTSTSHDSKASTSPTSLRSDLLASPPPRIVEPSGYVASTRATSGEARRDSTSTQTTVSSPPTIERILPPEEIIATIDRMRKEQRAAAAAASSCATSLGGDSTLGLGLSGVQIHDANAASANQQHALRSRPSYSGPRPGTSMSIDESFFSRSSSSSPFWSEDGKMSTGPLSPSRSPTISQFSMSGSNKHAAVSPIVELYYTTTGSGISSSSSSGGCGGGHGSNSSTPNLLDMPSPAMASPSSGQPRSLPVPPRMGKKSRSYANGLNNLGASNGAQSPLNASASSTHAASPNVSRLAPSKTSVQLPPSSNSKNATRSLSPSKKSTNRFSERTKDVQDAHDAHDEEDKENTFARGQDVKSSLTESKSNCSVETFREVQHSSSTNSFGIRQEHVVRPSSSVELGLDGNTHNNADLPSSMSALTLAQHRMPVATMH